MRQPLGVWGVFLLAGLGALLVAPARPAAAATPAMTVDGYVVFWDNGTSARTWRASVATYHETFLDTANLVTPDRITNQLPAWVGPYVRQHGLLSQISVANFSGAFFDGRLLHRLLTSPANEARVIRQLVALVAHTPFAGINVDFENAWPGDGPRLVQFLGALHGALKAVGKSLTIAVPAETPSEAAQGRNPYDYRAIAGQVDGVLVMAYDYSYQGGPPGPIAPLWWVRRVLQYAVTAVPLKKLALGLPVYGYDWTVRRGYPSQNPSLRQIDQWLGQHPTVHPQWNRAAAEPYYTYEDGAGRRHYVAYENGASIADKLRLARVYGVKTVFTWYVGSEDAGVRDVLTAAAGGNPASRVGGSS
jgi:spore germination protein YaaH